MRISDWSSDVCSSDLEGVFRYAAVNKPEGHRRFAGGRLVIASHNAGKVREIAALLAPFGAAVVSAGDLGLAEPDETGASFTANAELNAPAPATAAPLHALADLYTTAPDRRLAHPEQRPAPL